MYERALRGKEKAWGPDHTSTLDTVNNLGILYANQGKLAEAEQMYERALRGFEKAWGAKHTATLDTVNSLGVLYANQGKLADAERMCQRALRGKEKAWGPEHKSTLRTVNNLGFLYKQQCYVAAKLLTFGIVLAYVKQLASLCLKFSQSRLLLLEFIGRAFAWMGDGEKSAATFAHQLALNSSEYNAYCDGCDILLVVKS
jgi:tetratricopeptide (TPR) repeat protein